ncbi:tyrosine phosphatase family protein [Alsobacter sp. SYSU M60028]|uniref:Tyrosine phosphatase family protein n=1 Tax=Alsobacter ponti TaxID=2962936 RepID=A0ABT1LCA2_9HYPH|nr:tyrosine phosphatase family protein [Alsobacter ponti]MCP8939054.1 tyrosine phosphatase family protein [Alsobacter ponti]
MPAIHVTPLSRLHDTVEAIGASHVVTLINAATSVARPASIPAERHLFLGVSDITAATDGHILPGEEHVRRLLDFTRKWDAERPLLIHCWAGVSRSTAAAFIALCALRPTRDEAEIALRLRAASPSATPNARLVAVADNMLGRQGRMVDAVAAIGRGADCFENTPFHLKLDE